LAFRLAPYRTAGRAVRHMAVHEALGGLRVEVHQAQNPLVAPVGEAEGFIRLRSVRESPVCLAYPLIFRAHSLGMPRATRFRRTILGFLHCLSKHIRMRRRIH
jgi:hypothetical protein